jgi:hypothetical protein
MVFNMIVNNNSQPNSSDASVQVPREPIVALPSLPLLNELTVPEKPARFEKLTQLISSLLATLDHLVERALGPNKPENSAT